MRRISCLFILFCLAFGACKRAPRSEEHMPLSSGDVLTHVADWNGRMPYLNDSAPRHFLYITWKDSGEKELIQDGGWQRLDNQQAYGIWKCKEWVAVKLGCDLYWRANPKGAWQGGRFWSSVTLYEYIKARLREAAPEIQEEQSEYGRRLVLPGSAGMRFDVREKANAGWNLPYEIGEVDFDINQLVLTLKVPVAGLPETLVFEGPIGQFGGWIFSAEKTDLRRPNQSTTAQRASRVADR